MSVLFRNVGELASTVNQRKVEVAAASSRPIGIMTPVRSGDDADGIFKMHRTVIDQVRDNLRNLLLTNHGDRVVQFNFGANLRPLMLELTSQASFDVEAQNRIQRAVERHMPFIALSMFKSQIMMAPDDGSLARIIVTVTYDVTTLKVVGDTIDVVFFIGG
jgi:phage baseplate assembly protein W